jgi:hypothetical protein
MVTTSETKQLTTEGGSQGYRTVQSGTTSTVSGGRRVVGGGQRTTQVTSSSYGTGGSGTGIGGGSKHQTMTTTKTTTETNGGLRVSQVGRKSMADFSRSRVVSVMQGEGRLVEVNEGEGRIVQENTMEGYVKEVNIKEGETRVVKERELERSVRRSVAHKTTMNKEQEVIVEKKEKIIEIIKHVPKAVDKYVDVEIEVIVDIPIERIIEKEKIVEKIVEVPTEKIIEIPIEKVIEKPRKKVFEVDVHNPVQVEVIQEKIVKQVVTNPVEKINYSYRQIDVDERDLSRYNHMDNVEILRTNVDVEVVDKVVEVPRDEIKIIEKEVPRYVDNVVTVETFRKSKRRVPVPITVEVEKEKIVEVPVPVEVIKTVDRHVTEEYEVIKNVVERVPVEKIVEKEVVFDVIKEVEVPVYVDNIIEVPKEKIVEVPVEEEYIVEVPVEQIVENEIEIIKIVEKPVEKIVHKDVSTLNVKENKVQIEVENTNLIERPLILQNKTVNIQTIPRERQIVKDSIIETTVEVPRTMIESVDVELIEKHANIITNENTVQRAKHMDVVVDREVDELNIETVEMTRDKVIDVDVHETQEVLVENTVYNDVVKTVNTRKQVVNNESKMSTMTAEREDPNINNEINERHQQIEIWKNEGANLRERLSKIKSEYMTWKAKLTSRSQQEMLSLIRQYEQKMSEYKKWNQKRNMLLRKSVRRSNRRNEKKETRIHINPRIQELKRRLGMAVQENNRLCDRITNKADVLRKSLRRD